MSQPAEDRPDPFISKFDITTQSYGTWSPDQRLVAGLGSEHEALGPAQTLNHAVHRCCAEPAKPIRLSAPSLSVVGESTSNQSSSGSSLGGPKAQPDMPEQPKSVGRWRRVNIGIAATPTCLLCLANAISLLIGSLGYVVDLWHVSKVFTLVYFLFVGVGQLPLLAPALSGAFGIYLMIEHADKAKGVIGIYWRYLYGTIGVLAASNIVAFISKLTMEFWLHVLR